jgi:transposase-like protein
MSKYTDDFKAEILAVYVEDGPAATAKLYKVPRRTIQNWAKAAALGTSASSKKTTEAALISQAARRAIVRDLLIRRVQEMLERMDSPMRTWVGSGATPVEVEIERPSASACKDLATTAGILLDKFRLEAGEATERSEVTVTKVNREAAVEKLARKILDEAEHITSDASEG